MCVRGCLTHVPLGEVLVGRLEAHQTLLLVRVEHDLHDPRRHERPRRQRPTMHLNQREVVPRLALLVDRHVVGL